MHVSVLHPNLLNPHKRRTPKNSLEEAVSLANALDIEILHQTVVPYLMKGIFGINIVKRLNKNGELQFIFN